MKLRRDNKLIRFSTRTRIIVTISVFGVALATVTGLLVWTTASMNSVVRRAVLSQDIIMLNMGIARAASEQIRDAREIILAGKEDYSAYERHRRTARSRFSAWTRAIEGSIGSFGRSGGAQLEREHLVLKQEVESEYEVVDERLELALDLYREGDTANARLLVSDILQEDYETRFLPVMERVNTDERAIADTAVRDMESTSRLAGILSIALGLSAALIAIGISVALLRDVVVSTRRLRRGVEALGAGNMDARVEAGSGDFEMLARAFNDMAARLKESSEEQERVNAELKGYAHVVSHDLKGPLSSLGVANHLIRELAQRSVDENARAEMLDLTDSIRAIAERLNWLTSDLLALAEAGQQPESIDSVDIAEVVAEVIEEVEGQEPAREVQFVVGDDLGVHEANRVHIYQLFSNLVRNAVKHCGCSRPRVEVSSLGTDETGRKGFLVRDNGIGIAGDPGKIFEPFVKGENGGTGMGLAIVSRIVEVYGGEVRAYNENGACFEFWIARAQAKETPRGS